MKYTYLILFVMIGILGCKSGEKQDTKAEIVVPENIFKEYENKAMPEGVAAMYNFYHQENDSDISEEQKEIIEYVMANDLSYSPSEHGFFYRMDKSGSGNLLNEGDLVTVVYKGYYLEDKTLSDLVQGHVEVSFKVGQFFKGFNQAVEMMSKGSKGSFIFPSELCYGEEGLDSEGIPPYAKLLFNIEVLE